MQTCLLALLGLVASVDAFAGAGVPAAKPSTTGLCMSASSTQSFSRRDFLAGAVSFGASAVVGAALPAFAEGEVAEVAVDLSKPPTDWALTKDYYADAKKLVTHMRYAVAMEKTTPGIADTATKTRKEMTEFVSYYRRFPNVAGKLSYSNLYTSVNVLAGHYASYGPKFPVPEKRKKRLYQEFNDIEKALKRSR